MKASVDSKRRYAAVRSSRRPRRWPLSRTPTQPATVKPAARAIFRACKSSIRTRPAAVSRARAMVLNSPSPNRVRSRISASRSGLRMGLTSDPSGRGNRSGPFQARAGDNHLCIDLGRYGGGDKQLKQQFQAPDPVERDQRRRIRNHDHEPSRSSVSRSCSSWSSP